jgi:hypothetical protein
LGSVAAGVAGAWGAAVWAMPAVVIAPATRAETSTDLTFMCGVVLLRDPLGLSLSSRQATNPPSCPASTPPKATLARNQSLSFAQSATNHIAAGGLPQRLHYMVPLVEGQTHLPKSGANHADSPVYGEPRLGIRGRIGDLPQALLSRIWHSDCIIVGNGIAIMRYPAGRRCIHSRCAPDPGFHSRKGANSGGL